MGSLPLSNIKKYNTWSFGVNIKIWNLYDKQGNDVTDEWMQHRSLPNSNNAMKQSSKISMESLSFKMDQILSKLNSIEIKMNKNGYSEQKVDYNDNQLDAKKIALKAWLNKIGLVQYFNVFIENGVDDISIIALLKEKDLTEMGIGKIGHQKLIIHEVEKMKNQNDAPPGYKDEGTDTIDPNVTVYY